MLKNITAIIAVVVTILAALNVYGDFSAVEAEARTIAEAEGEAFLSQVSRNPIAQSYVFSVKGKSTIKVSCSKSAILVGEYSCKKED